MARITWQNVGGGDTRGPMAGMATAGETINRGMEGLIGVADTLKKDEIDSRTHAFKDYMASFNSPEELQAALQSGEVQEFSQRLGSLVDRDVVRDGADNRIASLYEQQDTDYLRGQTELAREALPIIDQAQQLQAAGKYDEARRLLEENQGNGFLLGTAALGIQQGEQATQTHQAQLDKLNQDLALGKITVEEANRQAQQLKEVDLVKQEYAKRAFAAREQRDRNSVAATNIAKTMFSVDELGEDGLPKPEVFQKDPNKLQVWNNLLNTYSDPANREGWEGANPDLFMDPEITDTAIQEGVLRDLVETGQISNDTALTLLNTPSALSSEGVRQGHDITRANQETRRIENEIADITEGNPLLGVSIIDAINDESTFSNMLEMIMPEGSTDSHIRGLRKALGELAAESMSNGEPIPAGVVLAYITQQQDDRNWLTRGWFNLTTDGGKNLKEGIHKFMASPAGKKAVAEHENLLALKSLYRNMTGNTYEGISSRVSTKDNENALRNVIE